MVVVTQRVGAIASPVTAASGDSRPEVGTGPDVGDNLYLIGRPPLKNFLRFVKSHAVAKADEGDLTATWQTAHKIVRDLERTEAGAADNPPLAKLGREYEPLLMEFLADPQVRNGFNTVPTEVAMVELDRMVVYQKHIDLTYVHQLTQQLQSKLSDEQIFRTCLLHDHPVPPVKWSCVAQDRFVFLSPSNDLRFLGALPLESAHITNCPPPGQLAGVVGIAVGFGRNFLNALYAEGRLILNNGSHRAYALRALGVTHVPCVVQHLATRDEVDVVGSREVRRNPDLFLNHPRPAMLKDYFNPQLFTVMRVHRRLRQITVRFAVEDNYVPVL